MYGEPNSSLRQAFWEQQCQKINVPLDEPIFFIGDFNALLGTEDKNEGLKVDDPDFENLRNFCSVFNLHDPGFSGPRFTWSNMQQGSDLILERLHRCLINQTAEDLFPKLCVNNLPRDSSDHFPMHIGFNYEDISMPRPFHFMAMWIEDPTCRDIIPNAWSVNVVGSPAYKLKAKLLSTKKGLRDWNKSSFDLKPFMNNIISQNQSAFIPKRSISNNILLANEAIYVVNHNDKVEGIAAIKLDMSKAYDKIEWDFLEKVLTKMGLSNHWVNLINQCISTVSYSVLLNGSPTSSKKGTLEGIRVCKEAPEMIHPMFADDSLLFSKATEKNFHVIKDYLQKYCLASGKEINFEKSGILFSRKIPEHRKAILANILDIQSRDLGEKYLRTPTVFQDSKIQTHMGILQAIDARISIWLHKLLSQAARTTLIKHIVQVIPPFQMRAFLIPKHLCKQMDSHLCKFWWGENLDPNDRKLHLLGWDILCSPKAEGGSGFRKAELNNLAMLARNSWRILENPNCLLSSVLKGKYLLKTDFLNAKCSAKCSWTWKCLHAIKELIKPFISCIVGDGQFIDPWCDKWIPSQGSATPNPLVPPDPSIKVAYFIDSQSRSWDVSRLNTHFDNASVQKIISIPLNQLCTPDMRAWDLSKNGKFSSKSTYLGLRSLRPSPCKNIWKCVWKVKVPYIIQNKPFLDCLLFWLTDHQSKLNNFIFQGIRENFTAVLARARAMLLTRNSRNPSLTTPSTIHVSISDKWMPHYFGWIKCNIDGAFDDISGDNGAGYVMRDFSRKATFCASLVFDVHSAEEAEARAIWAFLKKVVEQHLSHIIVESDAKALIDQFSAGNFDGDSKTDAIFKDILFFSSKLSACIFSFQPRSCNSVAHELAQWKKQNNSSMYWSKSHV
ncbi:uncharacterized protein LOC113352568 [Papaver somniferum]|uniref:uncharacterized protein LOC113352568 n=1 Tax=Papaver somniferum TaxID=3469 RepID=UPI000E6F5049|nr:uncharacterized protein LOC113352568 [Papaver somniferum]